MSKISKCIDANCFLKNFQATELENPPKLAFLLIKGAPLPPLTPHCFFGEGKVVCVAKALNLNGT